MSRKFWSFVLLLFFVLAYSGLSAQVIRGTIKDKTNLGLPGVSVLVKGTTIGTTTDLDGKFELDVKGGKNLEFTMIGYTNQTIAIQNAATEINILMEDDTQKLDEVVVTAMGIKKDAKRLGYAVSRINTEELTKTGTPNFATSLYGKAAGVKIQAAPGGATSAVSINIRGLNSITGTSQPLVIMDGVPIRNGEANNTGYWDNQRVNSNGLVDINPEDIAELSILKGASASALYGSEAANGVVLITTKSGKGQKGLGVDFSVMAAIDQVAFMPEFQEVFGPGVRPDSRTGDWLTGDGWQDYTINGKTYIRPQYEASTQFGPRFDGREVLYWDGTTRSYSPSKNGWDKVFRTGTSQIYNVAVTNATEKTNFRLSYSLQDSKNVQRESGNTRHNFSLVGATNLSKQVKIDYTVNYVVNNITNRPYRISRITNNFGGMFASFSDTQTMWDKTVTSLGYMFDLPGEKTLTPDESLLFNIAGNQLMSEYFWNIRKKRNLETSNRLMASITPTIQIFDDLSLRTRIATDLSSTKIENMNSTEKSLLIKENTGSYDLTNNRYDILYGDALLTYNKNLNEDFNLSLVAGYTARTEKYYSSTVGTNGGLSIENWFHLNASNLKANASMNKSELLKSSWLAMASLSYKNILFLEATGRREQSSTLHPDHNTLFYPSVNSSFIFTDAFREAMPSWLNFGKLRASWGIVGNPPALYAAYNAFNQNQISGFLYNQVSKNLGNIALRPEEKHEIEFGFEARMFAGRLGTEITFYNNRTKDQILDATTAMTWGAGSIIKNIGELQNRGLEISVYGSPIKTRDWDWELRGNISFNRNKVNSLIPGITELEHANYDGAVRLVSRVGEPAGDFFAHTPKKDANGRPIVGSNGLYEMDRTKWTKVGNATPDAIGGLSTSLRWKNWFFDGSLDFRIGGDVLNTPYQYMMGRGSLVESMPNRDAAHGGLTYYVITDKDGIRHNIAANSAPNGEKLWDDGMILPGVKIDGSENDIVVPSPTYYQETYNWGTEGNIDYSRSVFANTYVKVRELTLGYNIPSSIVSKLSIQGASLTFFARNPFYIYRNLPAFDAEATDGTNWISQAQIGGSTATTRTFGMSLRLKF